MRLKPWKEHWILVETTVYSLILNLNNLNAKFAATIMYAPTNVTSTFYNALREIFESSFKSSFNFQIISFKIV